MTRDKAWARPN